MTVHVDIETRSEADLKRVGLYRYAEDPSTEILLAETEHEQDGISVYAAHNSAFERVMLNAKRGKPGCPYHGPPLWPENMTCTMVRAAAMSLPLGLDMLGKVLNAPAQKDDAGHRLMLKMCKASYEPKPGEMDRLREYCAQDVRTEMAVDKLLPALTPRERAIWLLDQAINDRGFRIDVPLVEAALAAVKEAARYADRLMAEITDGAVTATTQTKRIVDWLNAQGVPCESVKQDGADELFLLASFFGNPACEEVIRLRLESSRAFKFQTMLDWVCRDGRLHGTLQYHGALSGRWTGRGPQPHNFKRIEDEADERAVSDTVRALMFKSAPEAIREIHALGHNPLDALSLIARACIVADPGNKLIGGDFSNIEGRINAWINGEAWKVAAFEAYDRGEGPDNYVVMAAQCLGLPVDRITRELRQIWGKVPELACGYQGGALAFNRMGGKYGVKLDDKKVKAIVAGWREQNAHIVGGWADLQSSAIQACEGRGAVVRALGGRVSFVRDRGYLFCKIPSGRVIAYPGAVVERKQKVVVIDGEEVAFDNWGVSFWGDKNGGWRKLDLYGGMQMAHVVSGTARDVLADAMMRLEAADYPIVLTVHDETVSEVSENFGDTTDYRRIMEQREPWFAGLPLTAKAWEGPRYGK
jgi:DNA polymerase